MHKFISRLALLFTLAVISTAAFSSIAQAQTIPEARFGTANPARVEEQLKRQEILPGVVPGLQIQRAKPAHAPAGSEKITFVLKAIKFEGVTVYSEDELEKLYAPEIGTTISLTEVYRIADALTRKYRDDGYILSQVVVPPQTIESGVIRLRAVEGVLDKIDVQASPDDTDHSLALIHRYLDQIDQNGALQSRQLERALLLINDLPGVSARAILSPSKTVTGASNLQIIVSRKAYDGEVSIDDFGTRYMGPVQLGAAGSLNSVLKNNERLTLQGSFAPDSSITQQMEYLSFSYLQPVGAYGSTLQLTGSDTLTHPGYNLKEFDVRGRAKTVSATVTHPVIRSRTTNLNAHLTFDYRNVITTDNVIGDPKREDHLRVLRAGGRFQTLDMLLGPSFDIVDLEFSKGLDVMGASQPGLASLSRPSGDPTFFKTNVELQRLQHIVDGVNLLAAAKGQITNDPLLSSEQFGVGGGNSYGRGYDPSEITGDNGVSGKLELQWNQPRKVEFLQSYQLYTFWDIGEVRNVNVAGASSPMLSLASAGVGTRFNINNATSGGLSIAFPLTRDVATKQDRSPTIYFNLSRKF